MPTQPTALAPPTDARTDTLTQAMALPTAPPEKLVSDELLDAIITRLVESPDLFRQIASRAKRPLGAEVTDYRVNWFKRQSQRVIHINPVLTLIPDDLDRLTDGEVLLRPAALTYMLMTIGAVNLNNVHPDVLTHLQSTMPHLLNWLVSASQRPFNRATASSVSYLDDHPSAVGEFGAVAWQLDAFLQWCGDIPVQNRPLWQPRPEHYMETKGRVSKIGVYTNNVDAEYSATACDVARVILGVMVNRDDLWTEYCGVEDMRYFATIKGNQVTRGTKNKVLGWCAERVLAVNHDDLNPYTILDAACRLYDEKQPFKIKDGQEVDCLSQMVAAPIYNTIYKHFENHIHKLAPKRQRELKGTDNA